jgi:hypothetical protein
LLTRRTLLVALGAMVASAASLALAHPHHESPISRQEAAEIAQGFLREMVRLQILDESWNGASAIRAEQKERDGHLEWMFSYLNPSAPDDKRVLYIFLSEIGEFIAANFSGR